MSNKLAITKNKMTKLGIKRNEQNDYEYIDPADKIKSKYKSVTKEIK